MTSNRLTIVSRQLPVFSPIGVVRKFIESVTGRRRYAIHRSLLMNTHMGLIAVGHSPIYEPVSRYQCSRHLVLFGYRENLNWAASFKREGRLSFIAIGPPIAPAWRSELLFYEPYRDVIDVIFSPSEYYRNRCIEEAPELEPLLQTWSCGVDLHVWGNDRETKRDGLEHVLVYEKNVPSELVNDVLVVISRLSMKVIHIKYGTYRQEELRDGLSRSKLAVFLSPCESQGIALAEAWACGVPTAVWMKTINPSRPYAAPLLTDETGRFFSTVEELSGLIQSREIYALQPRDWVKRNLTIESQARHLLRCCRLPC